MKRTIKTKVFGTLIGMFAVVQLAACATFGNMEKGLNQLMSQPFEAAIDTLGYPKGQMQIGEHTVYAWGRSFEMSMPTTSTSNTTGYVGYKPFNATTNTTSWQTAEYSCDIRVVVGPDNIIKNWEFDGNIGGCEAYPKRLKPKD